jgi:hypothetical protein
MILLGGSVIEMAPFGVFFRRFDWFICNLRLQRQGCSGFWRPSKVCAQFVTLSGFKNQQVCLPAASDTEIDFPSKSTATEEKRLKPF